MLEGLAREALISSAARPRARAVSLACGSATSPSTGLRPRAHIWVSDPGVNKCCDGLRQYLAALRGRADFALAGASRRKCAYRATGDPPPLPLVRY